MVFHFHSVLALELIALVAGVALFMFVKMQDKLKKGWLSFVAWFVIVLASLSIICTVIYGINLRYQGFFDMSHMKMMHERVMDKSQYMKPGNK